ncbi:MAG: hypothetical protein ACE5FF_08465 [Saprospiraceae bacterium]
MKRTSFISLLASTFLVLTLFLSNSGCNNTETSTCCEQQDTCDLPAPTNLTASIPSNTGEVILKIKWDSVPGAKFYYVDVMDVTSDTFVYANAKVFGDSIDLAFPSYDSLNEYKVAVAAVCDNCVASEQAALFNLCPVIIIEDIVMMECTGPNIVCDCANNTLINNPVIFPATPFRRLYRVKIDYNGDRAAFPVEVQRPSPSTVGLEVSLPQTGQICGVGNIVNPPVKSGPYEARGAIGGTNYTVDFSCSSMTINIPRGAELTLLECNGCN